MLACPDCEWFDSGECRLDGIPPFDCCGLDPADARSCRYFADPPRKVYSYFAVEVTDPGTGASAFFLSWLANDTSLPIFTDCPDEMVPCWKFSEAAVIYNHLRKLCPIVKLVAIK